MSFRFFQFSVFFLFYNRTLNLFPMDFPLRCEGQEKAMAPAGHVSKLHPEILGVIN